MSLPPPKPPETAAELLAEFLAGRLALASNRTAVWSSTDGKTHVGIPLVPGFAKWLEEMRYEARPSQRSRAA